jgi:hypothetical protein
MKKPFKINFPNGLTATSIRIHRFSELPEALRQLGLHYPRPTLVLVGGAGGLSESDLVRLRPIFVKVLAPLAEDLGAFVVDGGTDAGVMRLMGQARTEICATFPLVGVAVAKTVAFPGELLSCYEHETALIEPNHTHFLLVPGSGWGDESPWLTRVASVLANGEPSITVLVNGGEIARKDVNHSLADQRPVVVVAGTGRLADEMAAVSERLPLVDVVDLAAGLEKAAAVLETLLRG